MLCVEVRGCEPVCVSVFTVALELCVSLDVSIWVSLVRCCVKAWGAAVEVGLA